MLAKTKSQTSTPLITGFFMPTGMLGLATRLRALRPTRASYGNRRGKKRVADTERAGLFDKAERSSRDTASGSFGLTFQPLFSALMRTAMDCLLPRGANPIRRAVLTTATICLAVAHGAQAAEPEAVYLTWQGDPTTTMTVHWLEPEPGGSHWVHYRRRDQEVCTVVEGEARQLRDTGRIAHRTQLLGLLPDTEYEFRINQETKAYRFRTMPIHAEDGIRFVEGGDMMREAHWFEATCRAAASHDPRFVVTGGDLAYANNLPERAHRWVEYLQIWSQTMIDSEGRLIPVVPTIGNHEMTGGKWDLNNTADADQFYSAYAIPNDRSYRTLDFGSYLTLVLLDTDHSAQIDGPQLDWLDENLAERRRLGTHHVFPVYHVPAWPSHRTINDGRSVRVRKYFAPVFEKYDVDIAFENHDHTYKRTHRLRSGAIDSTGVLYIGDGAWGVEPRPIKENDNTETWYLHNSQSTQNFIVIDLQGRNRTVRAFSPDNQLIDQYP